MSVATGDGANRSEKGVTAPRGFEASGVACGIKASGDLDLALVVTADRKAVPTAGVFTTNKACAAPVQISKRHLELTRGQSVGVVINSGNANAATGKTGREHAWKTTEEVGKALGVGGHSILVCSTGLIGIPLPFGKIQGGIKGLVSSLGSSLDDGERAARAIMTTDTRMKVAGYSSPQGFSVGGVAKGAAMLEPAMATMLAVITTDAVASAENLSVALSHAVAGSFNHLVVDGATSTNDTVLVFASGASRVRPSPGELVEGLASVCASLAFQMAADAEGGTKVARITVTGARDDADALQGARKIASSLLVKCSLHGEDPYWGRIVSELGSAGIEFDIDRASVFYGGVEVCRGGVAVDHDSRRVADHMAGRELEIIADLGLGSGSGSILGTDISHAYIDENVRTS